MLNAGTVLVVDSDTNNRQAVVGCAFQRSETPILCSSYREARSLLTQHRFKVVFCNDELPDGKYVEVIEAAKPAPVVILSRLGGWSMYLDALDAGAFDYIAYPVYKSEVDRILCLALNRCSQTAHKRGAAAG